LLLLFCLFVARSGFLCPKWHSIEPEVANY
jgi:hypothetical protein